MTSRYGRELTFGLSIVPTSADLETARALARRADELGLELIGIQDHPYQWRFLDTWSLMGDLLARTQRVHVFPDVANLPLRGAAMIAKQAASLDVLSGGRFELGLGSGAFWEAVRAMGGPVRSGREALQSLEEAIAIVRAFWSGDRTISVEGEHYSVKGVHPGPAPVHPIQVWLGVGKPRALELTGRVADGWIPSSGWATADNVPDMQRHIDAGAAAAGRDPAEIRRLYNVSGRVAHGPTRGLLDGPPEHWVETLESFASDLGFDTFVFWPGDEPLAQLDRFAQEVVPALRAGGASRGAPGVLLR